MKRERSEERYRILLIRKPQINGPRSFFRNEWLVTTERSSVERSRANRRNRTKAITMANITEIAAKSVLLVQPYLNLLN